MSDTNGAASTLSTDDPDEVPLFPGRTLKEVRGLRVKKIDPDDASFCVPFSGRWNASMTEVELLETFRDDETFGVEVEALDKHGKAIAVTSRTWTENPRKDTATAPDASSSGEAPPATQTSPPPSPQPPLETTSEPSKRTAPARGTPVGTTLKVGEFPIPPNLSPSERNTWMMFGMMFQQMAAAHQQQLASSQEQARISQIALADSTRSLTRDPTAIDDRVRALKEQLSEKDRTHAEQAAQQARINSTLASAHTKELDSLRGANTRLHNELLESQQRLRLVVDELNALRASIGEGKSTEDKIINVVVDKLGPQLVEKGADLVGKAIDKFGNGGGKKKGGT